MAGLKGKSGPPGNMNAFKHARKIFCINSSRLISPFSIKSFVSDQSAQSLRQAVLLTARFVAFNPS